MKKNNLVKLFILLSTLLISVVPAQAVFHHSIGDFWERLTSQVEDELDRSRIGRELRRAIENLEEVARIAQEIQGLVSIVSSASPPLAIANLAIRYGHDPDSAFDRFKERVESLQTQSGGQLSQREAAAALQTVLEEPPLPDGIYMGDACYIDFTGCPDESENPQPRYRSSYWDYSCYADGIVTKKRVNDLNKAACMVDWINPWGRNRVEVKFPVNQQDATYDWERCPRVLLTGQEQRSFLASREQVCNQPISNYDLGDVCVVDYASCSYGAGGGYNANRMGTINFGEVINRNFGFRREYACGIANGNYALKENLRDSCATVYVGDVEVSNFLALNPEPIAQPVQPVQLVQQPRLEANPTNPIQVPGIIPRDLSLFAGNLADASIIEEEPEEEIAYGRGGIVNIAPPNIDEKKQKIKERLMQYGASREFDLDGIKKEIEGKALPSPFKSIFGNERAEITVNREYSEDIVVCAVASKGVIEQFGPCPEDGSFQPTIFITTSQSVIEKFNGKEDIAAALEDGRINYKAVGILKRAKFGLAAIALKSLK